MRSQEELHLIFRNWISSKETRLLDLLSLCKDIEQPHRSYGGCPSPITMCLTTDDDENRISSRNTRVLLTMLPKTEPLVEEKPGISDYWINLLSEIEPNDAMTIMTSNVFEKIDLTKHFVPAITSMKKSDFFEAMLMYALEKNTPIPKLENRILNVCKIHEQDFMWYISETNAQTCKTIIRQLKEQGWNCNQRYSAELNLDNENSREFMQDQGLENKELSNFEVTPLAYSLLYGLPDLLSPLIAAGADFEGFDHMVFKASDEQFVETHEWSLDAIKEFAQIDSPDLWNKVSSIYESYRSSQAANTLLDELLPGIDANRACKPGV